MFVVSAGMERSGTRWYYNLTNDLVIAAGYADAREVREKYRLHSILTTDNCNLPRQGAWKLRRLERISRETDLFAIKTHRRPSRAMRRFLAGGRVRAAYICRDIRDVIVSGLEYGVRKRAEGNLRRIWLVGPYRGFARLNTVKGGILWARLQLIPRWKGWVSCPSVLITRYEDLMADTCGQLRRLADHLELEVSDEVIEQVVGTYRKDEPGASQKFAFLNKAVIGRYREVMSPEEQALCRGHLAPYLEKMGYLE